MDNFATRFQTALDARKMKQAEIVSLTKIGKSSVSTYLSGEYEPKQKNVYKIAKALNVDEAWLMGHDVPMERSDKHTTPSDLIPFRPKSRIPIFGKIPAGVAALAVEDVEGYVMYDVRNPEECFALRVNGDSMINAGICQGDLVIVRTQTYADNGQIVACRINGDESTLKRFTQQGDTVVLMPENSKYSPIIVNCSDFDNGYASIIGVAIEVKRILI